MPTSESLYVPGGPDGATETVDTRSPAPNQLTADIRDGTADTPLGVAPIAAPAAVVPTAGAGQISVAHGGNPAGTDGVEVVVLRKSGNEVDTITITGTPTGGTFTCTLYGQTTAAIAFNATAAAVQTAFEGLAAVGVGQVVAAGGPLPGTAVTLTFQGKLAGVDIPAITTTDSLTGGVTPASSVAETVKGFPNDITGAAQYVLFKKFTGAASPVVVTGLNRGTHKIRARGVEIAVAGTRRVGRFSADSADVVVT